ncbi:MAG: hypothetical protein QOH28_650 [Actinomycetota bacterium]|nr:hypothetical protein [Actinomycetota bacterium]
MWALGATVRGRARVRLRFVAVVLLVATGVAVPLTASASGGVPHGVGPPFLPVASPNPSGTTDSVLNDVSCTSSTNCFAVGYSGSGTLIERWNGISWAIVPSPNPPGALYDVSCTSATNCFAVGSSASGTLVERWNGTSWAIVPSPKPTGTGGSELYGVSCTSSTNCFAVGDYGNISGAIDTLVEHWNGTSWAIVPSPSPIPPIVPWKSILYGVSCTSTTSCFAVGSVGHEPGPFDPLVERWDGTSWAVVPSPSPGTIIGAPNSALYGVSCTSTTSCFAVGYSYDFIQDTGAVGAFIERWNGTSWAIVPSPYPTGLPENTLTGVSCTSTTTCFAVGSFTKKIGGHSVTLVERWNGTSWEIVPSANPARGDNALNGVSCTGNRSCFAVGYSSEGTLIERRR